MLRKRTTALALVGVLALSPGVLSACGEGAERQVQKGADKLEDKAQKAGNQVDKAADKAANDDKSGGGGGGGGY